ncbi:unnamed protein product [Orchesella dallaii]|uniref:Receptor-type tyrosine-protein phosphatase N2 n=1 Tax=Orchesella dallaii TaxID=48710 RepID=A0ABP1QBB4_9HEXA
MRVTTVRMKSRIFCLINVFVIYACVTGCEGKPTQAVTPNDFGTYLKDGQIITGYIGCLFSKSLCEQTTEWCYNDGAFGRCLSNSGVIDQESLYRYDLSKSDAHLVEKEMERLFAMGYRWGHLYTQCVLQTLLESIRRGFQWEQSICSEVQDQDLEGALKAFEEDIDPKNLAYIKYHPSSTDFAEENYRPPKELKHLKNSPIIEGREKLFEPEEHMKASEQFKQQALELAANELPPPSSSGVMDQKVLEEDLENAVQKTKVKPPNKGKGKSGKNKNKGKGERQPVKKSLLNMEYPYNLYNLQSSSGNRLENKQEQELPSVGDTNQLSQAEEQALLTGLLRDYSNTFAMDDDVQLSPMLQPKIFSTFYNTPDLFRLGVESKDETPSSPLLYGNGIGSTSGSGYERSFANVDGDISELQGQRARQEELNRQEDEQEIRNTAAQLEAALLAESVLRNDVEQEDTRRSESRNKFSQVEEEGEPLEYLLPGHYSLPLISAQDPISQLASFQGSPSFPDAFSDGYGARTSKSDYEDLQNDEPEQDDRKLLYTEGGLIFLNKNNKNSYNDWISGREPSGPAPSNRIDDLGFYDAPLTKEDQESLMYLKRFIGNPSAPAKEMELMRAERERPTGGFDAPEYLLYGNPESVGDMTGNGYEELDSILENGYGGGNMGFERQERLDVKKPGPWYRTVNNYAFDKEDIDAVPPIDLSVVQRGGENPEFGAAEGPADMVQYDTKDGGNTPSTKTESSEKSGQHEELPSPKLGYMDMNKKSVPVVFGKKWADHGGDIEIVDKSYVNLELDRNVNWNGAEELINLISELLDVDRSKFKDVLANEKVVSFKVEENDKGLNSTTVAQRIDKLKDKVKQELGVKILQTNVGVGIKENTKIPSVSAQYVDQDPTSNRMFIATFAVCGLVAAVLISAVALFLVRKHAKSKEKLVRLSQDDPSYEACKDYQELCRARMAGSKNNEKMEPLLGSSRKVTSKDSDNGSSSSRSEEPVLTNMDISTGHMVLSYMEDHLKNRDRMDREWAALAAYEADPCSTAVAEKPENAKKNRFSNSLPFDHSRVILNDLANISGTDYINASTITDHDPRNPAYIATQGPLPNTVADFWQMVWEQGSVVIVNLTRLAENGTALCHRYWPEEGSELHHIYEVHLVSEHIWCDEYLVRSFYLKNLKTGETRTVTQFHFLAWPENGIPQSTKALLEFRRKVNKSYRGRSCPIIVHCSDGAGRSGTYCLIDMVLNRMSKGAKEIDIAATLEHIRDQRPNMVRSKQQFEFVLMAVAEEVHAILKALPQ